MDIAICVVLVSVESYLSNIGSRGEGSPRPLTTFISPFLLHYVLFKSYRLYLYPRFFSPLRHVPGPRGSNIILGQELDKFRADSPIALQLDWSRRWPDAPFIRYASIAGREALIVNSIAAHKAVLQTHAYDFVKPPLFARLVGEIAGRGLLFAEGEDHRHQRKLLAGPFSVPSMRKILPVFRRKAESLSKSFQEALGDRPHASIEVIDALSKSTMDTIGVTVLGIELATLSSIYPVGFQELYSRVLHQGLLGQLIWVVNAFIPIRRFVPLEANRRFQQANRDLRKMLRAIIEKRDADLRDGTFKKEMGASRDLLTYMLEESELQRQQTGREPWTTEDIIGHVLIIVMRTYVAPEFYLGRQATLYISVKQLERDEICLASHPSLIRYIVGHETTANTLSWALYALSTRHPVQHKLRTEIRALLERNPTPTYDEINGLPYLHNVVREVLRVYSPSLMGPRQASKDLIIEGVRIPKGTQIDLHMPLLHHRQDVWGPDASVFDPERWDTRTGDGASLYAFEAFIQGPRMCPGKNFALTQIKATLIELVSKWRFLGIERWDGPEKKKSDHGSERELLVDGEEEVGRGVKLANPTLTYRPAGGLLVRFERLR
ncbi:cytochrome P450 3A5 [Xylaria cubensis]|nr:cytochrome P450 3A5 [Xylaria cubensis]